MNSKERFIETLTFGKPDRIPFIPGHGRESTLDRWHKEGLPKNIENRTFVSKYAYEQAGGKLELPIDGPGFPIREGMFPEFEKKVIEKRENTQIVQDWKGNICEIGNEYTIDHLGGSNVRADFVTRRWIKCPVENDDDWRDMQRRYNPDDPIRIPKNSMELSEILQTREYPIEIRFSGPYWQLRDWMGFEQLSMAFYDNPSLVNDMIEFWTEYVSKLIKKVFNCVTPDSIYISEDMAYKGFSMPSP